MVNWEDIDAAHGPEKPKTVDLRKEQLKKDVADAKTALENELYSWQKLESDASWVVDRIADLVGNMIALERTTDDT